MTHEIVGVAEASAIRTRRAEEPPPNLVSPLIAGEMIFVDDTEDLHGLRGKNSSLTEHGFTLRTEKGEHNGKTGHFAWAVPVGEE